MRSFPSGFTTEKNTPAGTKPRWMLLFHFPIPLYLADQQMDVAMPLLAGAIRSDGTGYKAGDVDLPLCGGTVSTRFYGWLDFLGRLDDRIADADLLAAASDLKLGLIDDPAAAGGRNWSWWMDQGDTVLEQADVDLLLWFDGLNAVTDPPQLVWRGTLRDYERLDELRWALDLVDEATRRNQPVGTVITRTLYPNADPDTLGLIEPIVIGTVADAPALPVDAGVNSTLSFDLPAAQTHLYYSDTGAAFTASGSAYIDAEEIIYTGKTTEVLNGVTHGKLTGLTRGANSTTDVIHNKGAAVVQVQATYRYLASGRVMKAGRGVKVDGVLQPGTAYTWELNSLGKAYITFTVLPVLRKQLNIGLNDTIAVNDTIGVSNADFRTTETQQATSSFPVTVTSAGATILFPALPAGATFVRQTATIQFNNGTWNNTVDVFTLGGKVVKPIVGGGAPQTLLLFTDTADDSLACVNTGSNSFTVGNVTREITYDKPTDAAKTGAATKSGTVGITGNTAAETVIGGEVTFDGDGVPDDQVGSITGSANALIERPDHVAKWAAREFLGVALADLVVSGDAAGLYGSTYKFAGRLAEQRAILDYFRQWALEGRAYFRLRAGKATWFVRPNSLASVKTQTKADVLMEGEEGPFTTLRRRRTVDAEVLTAVQVHYDRDWTKARGEDAYRAVTGRTTDNAAVAKYGVREKPDRFWFDWVRASAMAESARDFYLARHKGRRALLTYEVPLTQAELESFDAITLQHPLAPSGSILGELSEVNPVPGSGRDNRLDCIELTLQEYG